MAGYHGRTQAAIHETYTGYVAAALAPGLTWAKVDMQARGSRAFRLREEPYVPTASPNFPGVRSGPLRAEGSKAASSKARIFALVQDKNLSESFAAVLHLVAVMDTGSPLTPKSEEERTSWEGYRRGLISALLCVAMHEQQCAPAAAAVLVSLLLDKARAILCTTPNDGEA